MVRTLHIVVLGLFVCMVTACGNYQKLLKSTDNAAKLRVANQLYNARKYDKALELYENVLPFYKASAEAEEVAYHYAKAYYLNAEYLLAAYHLKNFTISYPQSPYAEECAFLVGKSYTLVSPWYKLDQEYSTKAISELQSFTNTYPKSKFKDEANKTVDEVHAKLDLKARNAALLYFNIGNYNACAVSLRDFLLDFPDSPNVEWAQYMMARAQFLYAHNSIDTKKEERYRTCLATCKLYDNTYPHGAYIKETKKFTTEILFYFKTKNISI